ncbi:MAG: SOS response-associated peptidase [Candidatus Elarobacter sp.]
MADMCARFSLAGPERIAERYPGFRLRGAGSRRYNIAPTDSVLAARNDRDIVPLRWGLVPFWAKDLAIGQRLINARAETLSEKPAFRHALKSRRCVIFADGFYEWTGLKGKKQPYRFTVDDGAPFGFAGLWESWGREESRVETCTIVTCAPNALCGSIHDRMPVILDDGALEVWLDGDVADAMAALVPFDTARMRSHPVTPLMNRVTFEHPDCLESVTI